MKFAIAFAIVIMVAIVIPFGIDYSERRAADKKSGKKEYTKSEWF